MINANTTSDKNGRSQILYLSISAAAWIGCFFIGVNILNGVEAFELMGRPKILSGEELKHLLTGYGLVFFSLGVLAGILELITYAISSPPDAENGDIKKSKSVRNVAIFEIVVCLLVTVFLGAFGIPPFNRPIFATVFCVGMVISALAGLWGVLSFCSPCFRVSRNSGDKNIDNIT